MASGHVLATPISFIPRCAVGGGRRFRAHGLPSSSTFLGSVRQFISYVRGTSIHGSRCDVLRGRRRLMSRFGVLSGWAWYVRIHVAS